MTHIAVAEQLDGKTANWMEKVSDEQYGGVGAKKAEQSWAKLGLSQVPVATSEPALRIGWTMDIFQCEL
jgi:hypothetical protein